MTVASAQRDSSERRLNVTTHLPDGAAGAGTAPEAGAGGGAPVHPGGPHAAPANVGPGERHMDAGVGSRLRAGGRCPHDPELHREDGRPNLLEN